MYSRIIADFVYKVKNVSLVYTLHVELVLHNQCSPHHLLVLCNMLVMPCW